MTPFMGSSKESMKVVYQIQNQIVKNWLIGKLKKHPALHLHEYKERGQTGIVTFTFDAPIRNLSPLCSQINHLDFCHEHGKKAFEFSKEVRQEKDYKA